MYAVAVAGRSVPELTPAEDSDEQALLNKSLDQIHSTADASDPRHGKSYRDLLTETFKKHDVNGNSLLEKGELKALLDDEQEGAQWDSLRQSRDATGVSLAELLSFAAVSYTHLTLPTKRIV
eukprot:TRINITY_DN60520_c0_g1_i1.p2 TRINITY_DN60520_c0_g1~~TRINITY_DN60520_c0_g1_i1.p2  ORF type:complete len:122 (-),score=26.19 TRINITY_DN60520_c0_g1_i1:17-382(-)